MTCIVGVVDQGKVWMGADSAGSRSIAHIRIRADEKVFRVEDFLVGFTTSFRMGQLLRFGFTPPEHPEGVSPYEYMVRLFVEAVRKRLKEGGFLEKNKERESGGEFLVGYRGELFTVESDFQVGRASEPFAVVGCGDQVAVGALWASVSLGKPRGRRRALLALRTAERFCAGVRGPFRLLSQRAAK